jgi:hypothetical protein
MASINIAGDTSGTITLSAPLVAGSNTVTLPAATGTIELLARSTAQNSTSGTSIDFTGIPSWVKRITVMFSGVSTNGTSNLQLQIGDSGGIENTGYVGGAFDYSIVVHSSTGAVITSQCAAAFNFNGAILISNLTGNTWTFNGTVGGNSTQFIASSGSSKTLSDVLTTVRITTVNGTDTFDAGSINVMWEG